MGRKKTTETDAAATRARIIETAETLFREVGYAKTTVADIAKALGMSPANVYRYFPAKSNINEAICDRLVHHFESQSLEALGQGGTSTERLTRFILEYHRVIKGNIIKEKRLYDMVTVAMGEHWTIIQDHCDRQRELIRRILDQGMASGEFRTMDSQAMARALQDALSAFVYPALLEHRLNEAAESGHPGREEEELRHMLDLLFHGLASRQQ